MFTSNKGSKEVYIQAHLLIWAALPQQLSNLPPAQQRFHSSASHGKQDESPQSAQTSCLGKLQTTLCSRAGWSSSA
eukprot:5636892-Pleurochrysis_carterae.AAC.4